MAQIFRPIKYAEKVGVNFQTNELHLYGAVEWETEPWLITFGNNVHITDGAKFITYDGGTLFYRKQVPDLEITKPIVGRARQLLLAIMISAWMM